jgi:hypothetical protein
VEALEERALLSLTVYTEVGNNAGGTSFQTTLLQNASEPSPIDFTKDTQYTDQYTDAESITSVSSTYNLSNNITVFGDLQVSNDSMVTNFLANPTNVYDYSNAGSRTNTDFISDTTGTLNFTYSIQSSGGYQNFADSDFVEAAVNQVGISYTDANGVSQDVSLTNGSGSLSVPISPLREIVVSDGNGFATAGYSIQGSTSVQIQWEYVSPQITTTALEWNTQAGGVDFGYQVSGGPLPANSSVDFYWASGPSEADELEDQPIYSSPATGLTTGSYGTYNIPASSLGTAPDDAEYLLAVAHSGPANAQTDSVMSVAYDPFTMDSATSPSSKSISFTYDVNEAEPGQSFDVGVYRSSSPTFDPSTAIPVNQVPVPSLDMNGDLSEALGNHTVAIQDPSALLPDPSHEYVYVVADPMHLIGDPDGTYHVAGYRKFVLGVVAHGFALTGQVSGVPAWEPTMATELKTVEGYNQVIAFDWSNTSNVPLYGLAVSAGNTLESQIVSAADALVQSEGAPGDVVDLQLIGNSRGAVVISQALQDLVGTTDTTLAGGYKLMTLLDPHPANNSYQMQDYSAGTDLFSQFLVSLYHTVQGDMQDPQVVIPPNVDYVQDIYQQTPASMFSTLVTTDAYLNLWGEAPGLLINLSSASIDWTDLTDYVDPQLGPVGHLELPYWYLNDVVDLGSAIPFPAYGSGSPDTASLALPVTPSLIDRSTTAGSPMSPSSSSGVVAVGPPPAVTSQTVQQTVVVSPNPENMVQPSPQARTATRPPMPKATSHSLRRTVVLQSVKPAKKPLGLGSSNTSILSQPHDKPSAVYASSALTLPRGPLKAKSLSSP